MSIHNKIDGGGRVQGPPPIKTGAEWLVGVGFRCWLAGYDTGDIACEQLVVAAGPWPAWASPVW